MNMRNLICSVGQSTCSISDRAIEGIITKLPCLRKFGNMIQIWNPKVQRKGGLQLGLGLPSSVQSTFYILQCSTSYYTHLLHKSTA